MSTSHIPAVSASYMADQRGFTTTGTEFMTMTSDLSASDSQVFSKAYIDSTSWECAKCNAVFEDCRELSEHASACVLADLLYQCSDCHQKFQYLSALCDHVDETKCKHEKTVTTSMRNEHERVKFNGSDYEAVLFFDGDARPNPGDAGGGFVLQDAYGRAMETRSINILHGKCSRHQAEYCALIKGLQVASAKGIRHLLAMGDSEVVINQMTTDYYATGDNDQLASLNRFAHKTATCFKKIAFEWVPARTNVEADRLAELGVLRRGSHEQLSLIS